MRGAIETALCQPLARETDVVRGSEKRHRDGCGIEDQ